jgi:hypothetical protein
MSQKRIRLQGRRRTSKGKLDETVLNIARRRWSSIKLIAKKLNDGVWLQKKTPNNA